MGVFKIVALVIGPVAGMTYAAFSLGKQLPRATKKFGNHIGLGYVYFKSTLKILKPEDQMPYQMINIVRKASQQSQALRRELRNTIKKAKQDFQKKNKEAMQKIDIKILEEVIPVNQESQNKKQSQIQESKKPQQEQSGSDIIEEVANLKAQILKNKKLKAESRKFYEEL